MTSPNFDKIAFVYRTTNTINGKTYIGVRTCKGDTNDNKYFGSGVAIKAAITKYGVANFTRKTLLIATAQYCYDIEAKLVDKSFVESIDNYNISLGGWGGNRGEVANKKHGATKKAAYADWSDEDKQVRRDFLTSIRPDMHTVPSGPYAAGWLGYWVTPSGNYITCREAALAHDIDSRTLRSRCRDNNNKVIVRYKEGYIPRSWVGSSWCDLGWGFISKEVHDGKT